MWNSRIVARAGLFAIALPALFASAALRAQTYTVQSITAPNFGAVAAGATATTVFQNNGSVSVVSGPGAYVTGAVTRGQVTIRCVNGSGVPRRCSTAGNRARVTIATNGSIAGRGQALTNFNAVAGGGTTLSGTTTGGSLDFLMAGWTASDQDRTFTLDVTMPVLGDNASLATTASSGFRVWTALNPTVPSTGLTANATAAIRRAASVTKIYDIQFGTVARPQTGSGEVNLLFTVSTPISGTTDRTVSGTSPPAILTSSTFSGGMFNLSGEPGTIFTLNAPTSTVLSGPGGNLTVTLTPSLASGSHSMVGGGIGLGYSATVTVGSGTASGTYTGTVYVSISYN